MTSHASGLLLLVLQVGKWGLHTDPSGAGNEPEPVFFKPHVLCYFIFLGQTVNVALAVPEAGS